MCMETEQTFSQRRHRNGQQVYMKGYSTSQIIRETQNKTTVRYYLISVRMVIIKKTRGNKCW